MVDRSASASQQPDSAHGEPAAGMVTVYFEGSGAGSGPLSWGQRELYQIIEKKPTWLPIGTVLPLPPGTTVTDVVDDLRFVMSAYPSMRTRIEVGPDGARQVVAGAGEATLEIVDADDDADPAAVADQVWDRYAKRDLDLATDWPLRMAVVRHRGVPTHRVWVMCHLASDGTGSRVILDELAGRDSSDSAACLSPLEQARWQQSPAGQRQCEAALRYWEKVLRSVPARRFPARAEAPHPRYWEARFDSPAMYHAARIISARTGVELASVLLAVFALGLARVTGIEPVLLVLVVNNRFRPGLTRTAGPLIQPGLCLLEIPDATVDELVVYARRRALIAYKNAYYDPDLREELVARVNRERGELVDIECALNDRRLRSADPGDPPSTAAQLSGAARGELRWLRGQDDRPFDKLYVYIDDVPDTVQLTIATDLHHVAPEAVGACLQAMEQTLVAAALDPATRTSALPS